MAEPKVSVTIRAKDLLTKSVRGMRTSLKGLATKGFQVAGRAAKRFSQILTASVAAGLALATRRAAEFSQRMGEVQTLLGPSSDAQKSVKSMSAAVLDMTAALPKSADDLGAGLYQVLSAGVEQGADAMRVLGVAAKAAVGGLSTTLESVDALTTVINAYGGDASKATAISDNMFQTIRDGKITYTELAASIGTVATTAALAKVPFGDLSAAIATMTKSGLDSAITTTSLNRLILAIISPQDQAAKAARRYGIELSSASLAQRGFAGLMADIAKATGGNIDALQAMFPEIRAFRAISILAGKNAGEFARLVDNQANSAGAASDAFEVMNKRISQQFQLFKNKLNVVLIELGQKLLPGFIEGMTGSAGILEQMRTFIAENDEQIRNLGASFAAMIPVVIRFASHIAKLAIKFGNLAATLNDLANPSAKFSRGLIEGNALAQKTGGVDVLARRANSFREQIGIKGRDVDSLKSELANLIQEAARAPESRALAFNKRILLLTGQIADSEAELAGITRGREDALRRIAQLRRAEALGGVGGGGGAGAGVSGGVGGGGRGGPVTNPFSIAAATFGQGSTGGIGVSGSTFGAAAGGIGVDVGGGVGSSAAFAGLTVAIDEARQKASEFNADLLKVSETTKDMNEAGRVFGVAFTVAFEDAIKGAKSVGDAFVKVTLGSIRTVARGLSQMQFAKAAADFAGGLWPPNPVQIAAGFKHLAAGGLFAAIGGAGGGRPASVGGGGSAPSGFSGSTPFSENRGSVTIKAPAGIGRFDDPLFLDWLARAVAAGRDRDVIIEAGGV